MNEDGSDIVRLTYSTAGEGRPAISPDGRTIVFVSTRTGFNQLWSMRPDGSQVRQLTDLPITVLGAPDWSPDSKKIALGATMLGAVSSDLFLMNPNGGGLIPIYAEPTADHDPRFSPDGTRIAFISSDPGVFVEVLSADLNGGDVQHLCPQNVMCGNATWSPDGTKLAFVAGNQIFVRDLSTLVETVVADGNGPVWSPDGLKIGFHHGVNNTSHIATVNADGSGLQVLTSFAPGTVSIMCSWGR